MRPDTETLNAYVDGELDKDSAAQVARAVAIDPVVARKVATLSKLRSALSDLPESIDAPALSIDDLVPPHATRPPARGSIHGYGKLMAIAACMAGLLIVGTFMYRDTATHIASEEWTSPILSAHNLWSLEDTTAETATFQPATFLSGELANLVYVPDLTSAKLQMVYVNPRHQIDGNDIFVAGYAGSRGCKITLVAQKAMGLLDDRLRDIKSPDMRVIAWNAGHLDYVLMSQGMDSSRFELIAATVRQSSLNHQPVNSETRVALGTSRAESAPCAA